MTSKHTPEPWHEGVGANEGVIFGPDETRMRADGDLGSCLYPVAQVAQGWATTEDAANAKRIVACVNALAGMPNDKVAEIRLLLHDLFVALVHVEQEACDNGQTWGTLESTDAQALYERIQAVLPGLLK